MGIHRRKEAFLPKKRCNLPFELNKGMSKIAITVKNISRISLVNLVVTIISVISSKKVVIFGGSLLSGGSSLWELYRDNYQLFYIFSSSPQEIWTLCRSSKTVERKVLKRFIPYCMWFRSNAGIWSRTKYGTWYNCQRFHLAREKSEWIKYTIFLEAVILIALQSLTRDGQSASWHSNNCG